MMEIGKTTREKEKELKLKFYNNFRCRWDSLNNLYYYFVFSCINGQMDSNMMEIGKTIWKKEEELN